MTPRKNFSKFLMNEQEMLSPIKTGIKLDINKLNVSNFNDSESYERQKERESERALDGEIKKNLKPSYIDSSESMKNAIRKEKSSKNISKVSLDKSSSSSAAASNDSEQVATSTSSSFYNSSDSDLTRKRKKKQNGTNQEESPKNISNQKTTERNTRTAKRKQEERGKQEEPGKLKGEEEHNKRKLQKQTTDMNFSLNKKQKTKHADTEIGKDKKRRKNFIDDDEDDDDDNDDDVTDNTTEIYEQNIKSPIKGGSSTSTTTKKGTVEGVSKMESMVRMQTRSSTLSADKSIKNIEFNESKKRKKQSNGEEKANTKSNTPNNTHNKVKKEEWENLNVEDSVVELVDENSCKYEDGTIFESILVNKVKYTINDNVSAYYHDGKINRYILRKGKISGIFQNFNSPKVEVEICFYIDDNDEEFIRDLESRQRSRRSKEDFVVFLDDKHKYYHLLGNIEFKIIEANYIKQLIYVYNEKREFEKDTESIIGKEKFLCLYYLKEREDRICEIQNEDHWDNLVLGSSNLYYYFTNNKKKSKNKSLQLIIDKLKINESISVSTYGKNTARGSVSNVAAHTTSHKDMTFSPTTSTPRKAQTTTHKATKFVEKQQKSKTTTHKESAKEKPSLPKEAEIKRSDTKKTDLKRTDTKKGAAADKGKNNLKFDLQHVINEDREKYYMNLLSTIKDPTDKAIRMMQLDVVPKYLPCREKEIKEVHNFLESGIKQAGSNQILYISGMPGTGKTATVYSVIQLLQLKSKKKMLPEFDVYEINGMNVVHPNAAYQVFYKQLFNKKPPNALNSYKIIDRLFNKTKKDDRNVAILIIDEIDYLITKTQKVLFTFFDWPTKVNSKLVLIAISNTMDLPERLIPRCRSRLAFGRLVFSPYKGDEIEKIIKERLENCKEVMDHTAIQLCARKVANVSGDIRKALQICRKAFENKRGLKIVPRDITEASNQLFDSPLSKAINILPWAFKIFLTCIIIELRMLNEFIIPFKKVINRYQTMIETSGKFVGICSDKELFKIMLDKLVKMGILLIRPYIPLEDLSKRSKEAVLGFNEPAKKSEAKNMKTQVSPDIDKEAGDMGLEINVETQLIITALMKDADCSKKLNFFT